MDKGIDTLIAFFSGIYAGCYYSLINPELPQNRIDQIIKTTRAKYVVTDDMHKNLAKKYFRGIKIIKIKRIHVLILEHNKFFKFFKC